MPQKLNKDTKISDLYKILYSKSFIPSLEANWQRHRVKYLVPLISVYLLLEDVLPYYVDIVEHLSQFLVAFLYRYG